MNNKAFSLIASVILIAFASIVIVGLSAFIVQRLKENEIQQHQIGSLYLSQAGIHQAIYTYRLRDLGPPPSAAGSFSLGQTNIDANHYFVKGATAGDLLMVNTSTAALSGNGRDLNSLTIQNATNSQTISIQTMIVTWNNGNRIRDIRINGQTVWQNNPGLLSPATCILLSPFTLNAAIHPRVYPINRLRFNADMTGATIGIQFLMTDGSNRTLQVFPQSNNYIFTVKSTGKSTNSPIYRTIEADYNANTSKIIRIKEIAQQITP